MAVRIINRNIVHIRDFIYGTRKSRCLHSSVKFDKNVQFCLSDIGEGIREVVVKSWHVKPEDEVSQFDNICDVESDKATVTITSRYDGVVKKLYYNIDDTALVGKPLVDIDVPEDVGDGTVSKRTDSEQTSETVVISDNKVVSGNRPVAEQCFMNDPVPVTVWDKSLATPAVRRIAAEHSIKISDVRATGKNNRVLKEDILTHIDNLNKPLDKVSSSKCEVRPVTRIMKTMIKTMTESNSIPKFGYSEDIDFTRLVEIKTRLSKYNDLKITYLPFILKGISKALFKYPILNASIDNDFKNIIYKPYHNIGIAVDSPDGLIVPNVKDVNRLSIIETANEIKRIQKAAFDNALTPNDLSNGTFTVSNIGAIGGIQGIPCILPPEVAIVAVGKIRKVPQYDAENQIVPALLVNFTFTADHRIIDGATVARFTNLLKDYLENPELLLIEL